MSKDKSEIIVAKLIALGDRLKKGETQLMPGMAQALEISCKGREIEITSNSIKSVLKNETDIEQAKQMAYELGQRTEQSKTLMMFLLAHLEALEREFPLEPQAASFKA